MNKNNHVYYFDYLRVIAAISVIYMHVAAGPLRRGINLDWHFIDFFTCLGFTAVPLFFMMSGYLILSSEKTLDVTVLFKKRLPHLIIPLAGWTLISIIWTMVYSKSFSLALLYDKIVTSLSSPAMVHMWYMYTLIAMYVLSPIIAAALRNLDRNGHIYVFVLASLVSVKAILRLLCPPAIDRYLEIDIINKITFFSGHLSSFVLGYYLGNLKKKLSNVALTISVIAVLAIITIGTYNLTIKSGEYNQSFQSQAAGFEVLLASLIFLLFKQNFNKPSKILKHIPIVPLSLSIYLMHNILLNMMYAVGFTVNSFFDTIWITFLNLIICLLTMKTVATIKPICYIATGMSYKAACNSCNWVFTYRWIRDLIKKN